MAQLDRPRRRDSPATTWDMLRDGDFLRRLNISPRHQDRAEDHNSHKSPQKKSVISKVKEKAKKFKHSLSFKKKHHDHDHDDATPSSFKEDEHEDGNAKIFGAPISESPKRCTEEEEKKHPKSGPVICEKHVLLNTTPSEEQNVTVESPDTKTLTKAQTIQNVLTEVSESVSEETGPETNINITGPPPIKIESGIWDKGVSVKDYLLNKFEPAEEDRALSRAISEAVIVQRSPRKASGGDDGGREASVADMVRDAVTSLLRNQSPQSSPRSTSSVETQSMMQHQMPVSTNAHEVEEENHGRILQTN